VCVCVSGCVSNHHSNNKTRFTQYIHTHTSRHATSPKSQLPRMSVRGNIVPRLVWDGQSFVCVFLFLCVFWKPDAAAAAAAACHNLS
jgi:hypothetical protein